MDAVFAHQIGWDLEAYVENMLVKQMEGYIHVDDLEDILQLIRKYDRRLNPATCSSGV